MLFKNARLYRFDSPADVPAAERLTSSLEAALFSPCSALQPESIGFVGPILEDETVHVQGDGLLLRLRRQEKVLPAAALNELLEERAVAFEARTGRAPRRTERRDLKDELRTELLPRALARSTFTWIAIDRRSGWLAIDTASASAAERAVDALRDALGGLAVTPLAFADGIPGLLARLLLGERVAGLEIGEHCLLSDPLHDTTDVRYRNADLDDPQLRAQVKAGFKPTALELVWRDQLRFIMNADAALTRIRSLETFDETSPQPGPDNGDDDAAVSAAADFALLHLTLRAVLDDLAAQLGGLA